MRKINYPVGKDFIEEYYKCLFKINSELILRNKIKIEDINNHLKKIFIDGKYTFKDIITADLDKLLEINNCIEHYIQIKLKKKIISKCVDDDEKKYVNQYFRNRIDEKTKITALNEKTNTTKRKNIKVKIDLALFDIVAFDKMPYEVESLSNQISSFFMNTSKDLKIKTCFYCNIDFVNAYTGHDGKSKNQYTLDHVLPKGKYPYFSLSLFNLVPSCYTCNSKLKKEKEFNINESLIKLSPSSKTYCFDQKIKFDLKINLDNEIIDLNNVKPSIINLDNNKELDGFIDIFQLKGRYNFHSDIAQEMVDKRAKYSNTQIKEIANILSTSENQVKEDIFGKELYEESNAPFEKYKNDIAKELRLI